MQLFHSIDISPSGVDNSRQVPDSSTTNTLILGRIRRVHIRNSVLSQDGLTVDTTALRAVARLGGIGYARVGEGFDLARPSWRVDEGKIREVLERKRSGL